MTQRRGDVDLVDLARPVADQSASLLAQGQARMLSFTKSSGLPAGRATMYWDDAWLPAPISRLIDLNDPTMRRLLTRFEAAGDRLVAQLVYRWPTYAVPPAIGVVTDGVGVAFSSDHPSPLRPDWLSLHQAGLCAPVNLLAFPFDSGWVRLTAAEADQWQH